MAYKNLREGCFFKTGREGVVLEWLDEIKPNLFDYNKDINNDVFRKYSVFKVTLVDSRKTSGTGNAVFYNLGPDEVTLLSYLLSDGNPEHFKKRAGAFSSASQTGQIFIRNLVQTFDRIDFARFDRAMNYDNIKEATSVTFQKNINTSKDNLMIRKFTLSYEEAMRSASKWKIIIEEGIGKKDVNKGNGLNIVKAGSFKSTNKSYLNLQVEEIVLPVNEAASRVMNAKQAFYPLMKVAEADFTRRKMDAKDYEGDRIDEWNPQGKVFSYKKEETSSKSEEETTEAVEEVKEVKEITKKETAEKQSETSESDKCSDCGADVSEKVKSYSISKFNKPLCYSCQKRVKAS